MPNYNLNTGFGQIVGQFPFTGSGKVFFVGDSGTANRAMLQGLFRNDPEGEVRFFSTIDAAVNVCTANAGDIIYVAAGHAESLSSATSLVLDVAGVRVIGLGAGADRPTLTFGTATTTTIDVTANNISMENIILDLTAIDAVAVGIDVSATDFALRNCKVILADSAGQAVLGLFADVSSDGLIVENNEFIGNTSGCTAAIKIEGDNDDTSLDGLSHQKTATIKDNVIIGLFDHTSGAAILMDIHACVNVEITDNYIQDLQTSSEIIIKGTYTTTGIVERNTLRSSNKSSTWHIANTGRTSSVAGGFGDASFNLNYGVNEPGTTGVLLGTASN